MSKKALTIIMISGIMLVGALICIDSSRLFAASDSADTNSGYERSEDVSHDAVVEHGVAHGNINCKVENEHASHDSSPDYFSRFILAVILLLIFQPRSGAVCVVVVGLCLFYDSCCCAVFLFILLLLLLAD